MDISFGLMDQFAQVISSTTIFMVKPHINGLMAENMLVTGSIIRCMDQELSIGMMVDNI